MTEKINLKAFAEMIGVSRERITAACKKGHLTVTASGQQKMVDPAVAKKEWAANVLPSTNPSGMGKGEKKTTKAKKKTTKTKVVTKEVKIEVPMFEGMTTADADRKKKVFEARLAELKFSEQAGQLIKVEDVKAEAYEMARATRDAILSLPARIAHEIAAETDPRQSELLLLKSLTKALQNLIKEKTRG